MSKVHILGAIVLAMVCFGGDFIGPTTAPASNGLAMTNDEIAHRLDLLNQNARSVGVVSPDDSFARKLTYVETQEDIAAKDQAIVVYLGNQIQGCEKEGREIQDRLAVVRESGTAAENQLRSILDRYDQRMALAQMAGTTSFSGTVSGTVGDQGFQGTFSGESYNPAITLAAISMVDDQYQPDIQDLKQQITSLYYEQRSLQSRLNQLAAIYNTAVVQRPVIFRQEQDAMTHAVFVRSQLEAAAAATQPVASDSGPAFIPPEAGAPHH